jgi:ribosomal protein S28E/S33
MQILDHGLDEGGATTLRIQILISQNQSTAPLDRSLRRNPKGPRMSDVEQAGGRRR